MTDLHNIPDPTDMRITFYLNKFQEYNDILCVPGLPSDLIDTVTALREEYRELLKSCHVYVVQDDKEMNEMISQHRKEYEE